MELNDFFEVNELLSIYKSLLSDKQKIYLEDFFENDFSLSEIASKHNISRQAVYDNIKKTVKLLKDYEEKLEILTKQKCLREKLMELKENFDKDKLEKIIEDL